MMRRRLVLALFAVPVLLAAMVACGQHGTERGAVMVFSVGDCVRVPAATPSSPEVVRATEVDCDADPSYTVGAIADENGTCPSREYQQLSSEFADPSTARLCLVPNLVANHCYELGMPAGMVELADCAEPARPGLLVQVTRRLDVRDRSACATEAGQFAWPYPSPARTYCTRTVY
ncbi:hypothetical protein [Mycolicibacterium goodii]|uniref:hypothetical protein n=1 Tax=Mycolicibacterium goodii TaxID=134601 RepID=UPI00257D4B6F|nr:hypothetical protein [Mycolicibacterium goodii]